MVGHRRADVVLLLLLLRAGAAPAEGAVGVTAAASAAAPPVESPMAPRSRRRPKFLPAAAGAAGMALGFALTPTKTDPLAGGVSTAEAWRRKIKARQPVPLVERAPTILLCAIACDTLAEWCIGLHDGLSPVDSLMQTRAASASREVARRAAVRLEPVTTRVVPVAHGAYGWCKARAEGVGSALRSTLA